LLVTSEAEASTAKIELDSLKEQATKWEVDITQLNADFTSKLQILLLLCYLTYICPANTNLSGICNLPTHTSNPNIFFIF
jgi:hypothetical protein